MVGLGRRSHARWMVAGEVVSKVGTWGKKENKAIEDGPARFATFLCGVELTPRGERHWPIHQQTSEIRILVSRRRRLRQGLDSGTSECSGMYGVEGSGDPDLP